ncbi:uncharacterized protein LOC134527262 [Bacillus rossius redtenbacheri]|uniref:uncharacterized protein LOC134527262 n=1 Tax=Bacillus rossius redtenbacheri TaxID=93214 RepID=UPI002FDC8764
MPRYCTFRNCTNTSLTHPSLHFYSFPVSRKDILDVWIISCEKPDLIDLSANQLKNRSVCEVHFTANSFMNETKHRLTSFAVPTENICNENVSATNIAFPLSQSSCLSNCNSHISHTIVTPKEDTITTNSPPLTAFPFAPAVNTAFNSSPVIAQTKSTMCNLSAIVPATCAASPPTRVVASLEHPLPTNTTSVCAFTSTTFTVLENSVVTGSVSVTTVPACIPSVVCVSKSIQSANISSSVCTLPTAIPRYVLPVSVPLTSLNTEQDSTEKFSAAQRQAENSAKEIRTYSKYDRCGILHKVRSDGVFVFSHTSHLDSGENTQDYSSKILCGSQLTPRKQKLKRKIEKQKSLLSKKRVIISRLKSRNLSVAELIPKMNEIFSEPAAVFMCMQFTHRKRSPYTENEKRFSLSCFYKSPALYKHLREQGLHLRSPGVIRTWLTRVPMTAGTNTALLKQLQAKVSTMDNDLEKNVTLMFDETVIKTLLQYDRKNDIIEGFEDMGAGKRSNKFAKQALVFMVRGMFHKWKLPISYFLTSSSVKCDVLKELIIEHITLLQEAGLIVRAIVCDQGPNNRAALRQLGVAEGNRYINVNGKKIHIVYDVPHLVKSARNNLMQHDIQYDEERRASWRDIEDIYALDSQCNKDKHAPKARSLPKIQEKHIAPKNFQKMSVKLATQVFSHSMEAGLLTAVATKQVVSETAVDTAVFVGRVNNIFDALNCNSLHSRNPFSCALSNHYPEVEEFLLDSAEFVDTWVAVGARAKKPPCFSGLSMTIRSIVDLWRELRLQGIEYVLTSRLNQDAIENMFSVLRYRGGFNANPSAQQLRHNLRAFVCTHLLKPAQSANCEPDEDALLSVFSKATAAVQDDTAARFDHLSDCDSDADGSELASEHTTEISECDSTLESCSVRYVAGYLAKKLENKYHCVTCRKSCSSPNMQLESHHNLLLFNRAYMAKEDRVGKLIAPSDMFFKVTDITLSTFTEVYPKCCSDKGVLGLIFKEVKKRVKNVYPCWFFGPCKKHRIYALIHLIRIRLNRELFWSSKKSCISAKKPPQKLRNLLHC